jgi:hypothetical protein
MEDSPEREEPNKEKGPGIILGPWNKYGRSLLEVERTTFRF